MYRQEDQEQKRIRLALLMVAVAAVAVIIMIAVLGLILGPKDKAQIVNGGAPSSSVISSADLARAKNEVYSLIQTGQEMKSDDLEMTVRWDTVQKGGTEAYPSTTFLVDVDEYQQSYRVAVDSEQVVVRCPTLGETKYPEIFCRGNAGEFDDSVGVVFGQLLPYEGKTSQGDGFVIDRNGFDYEEPLFVQAYACDTNEAALQRVNAAVDDLIVELGATPEMFGRKVEGINCEHLE